MRVEYTCLGMGVDCGNTAQIIRGCGHLYCYSVQFNLALEITMKGHAGLGEGVLHRLHNLNARPLQAFPHHHPEVAQASCVPVQVHLTWKHRSTTFTQKQENAQKESF